MERSYSAKDLIKLFCHLYRGTYGEPYKPNWGKDSGMIQNLFVDNYENDELFGMIHVAISQYQRRWATPKHPRPTIGMLCTWLGQQAMGFWLDEYQRKGAYDEKVYQKVKTTRSTMGYSPSTILDLFKIGKCLSQTDT